MRAFTRDVFQAAIALLLVMSGGIGTEAASQERNSALASPPAAQGQFDRPGTAARTQPQRAQPRPPFTKEDDAIAIVPGMPDARFWGDSERAFVAALGPAQGPWLALSGGGEDGAFGAGLLNGWTETGTRPEFAVVTGVSTGALIAPYVFAGPRYDQELRESFTTISAGDVFEDSTTPSSLLDTWPLRDLIARHITPQLVADIAAQHRAGRRMFVMTTNLDSGRPTVWNVGAIAAHGGEQAIKLVRQILLASASIPGIFPPVPIEVDANGRTFQELHGDGAINAPLFVAPESMLNKSKLAGLPTQSLYLLMNGKLTPDFTVTPNGKVSVLSRSIGLALQSSMRAEISRVHRAAHEAGIHFNLAYIEPDFTHPSVGIFDRSYMKALFARGFAQGKSGNPFTRELPGSPGETRVGEER